MRAASFAARPCRAANRCSAQVAEARGAALAIAEALGHVGVLTVEFFASADGPVVNEIAPRVHNSGHWTIEGAVTSQFEQHIRAICGLPPGVPASPRPRGDGKPDRRRGRSAGPSSLPSAALHLHLYGKDEARPGRKMGHFTTGRRVSSVPLSLSPLSFVGPAAILRDAANRGEDSSHRRNRCLPQRCARLSH